MPKGVGILRNPVVWWLFALAPMTGFAPSGEDFYQRLYQRGMAHFSAGDYALAFTELRNAAFGLVERVEMFETAETYAALAAHRLGHEADTRDALVRIVAAENVQPHFRSIKLPDELRLEIDTATAALLTREEATTLGVPASLMNAGRGKPKVAVPTPSKTPNVAITAPRKTGNEDTGPLKTDPPPPAPQPQTQAQRAVAPSAQQSLPAPVPQQADPVPQNVTPTPQSADPPVKPAVPDHELQAAPRNADTSLAEAQWAFGEGDIARARSIYDALLRDQQLPHATALRLAEGLYSVRDFAGACLAFQRAGAFNHGEEYNHFLYAVALYETGQYTNARRELAAALPFVAATEDVARYRAKIEGAPK